MENWMTNDYKKIADDMRKELGEDSPLAALIEKGPDEIERVANALLSPTKVSKDTIDGRVIDQFSRMIKETAKERGHKLEIVPPFIYDALYPEVMEEVKKKPQTYLGLQYYEVMVKQMPHLFCF